MAGRFATFLLNKITQNPVKLKKRKYVLINIIHFSEPGLGAGARGFWKKTSPKFPWAVFVSIFLAGSGLSFGQTNLSSYTPGTTYWGRSNYTEYIAGNLPLIISAPHGGDTNPAELPTRTNTSTYTVTTDPDLWTANLARAIRTAAFNRYGRYPHVVICRVVRSDVDCNRDIEEGAQNNTNTQTLWREFHAYLNIARQNVSNNYGRGLYIDLHGHGHTIQKNEIGYNLSDSDMFKSSLSSTDEDESTIRAMSRRSRLTFTELVRGELGLGGLLEKRGYPSVPSHLSPNQGVLNGVTNEYFNGGYNVQTYGTSLTNGGTIDAIQIECNFTNVRAKSSTSTYDEDVAIRALFASNLVASLDEYFKYHLEMTLDTQATPPASVNSSFSDKTIQEDGFTSTSSITLASANNIFWGESSDTNIVDNTTNCFVFGGSGTSRSLVVRPRTNAYGSNIIVMVYQQATNGGVGADWYYLNVTPVNDAPVFNSIVSTNINPGFNLTLPNPATDVENDTLTYSVLSGLPAGATFNPGTGTITWRPTIAQAGQSYSIVTKVTDNGTNLLASTNTNTIAVAAVQTPSVSVSWSNMMVGSNRSSQVRLSVQGQTGPDYILMASTNFTNWTAISTNTPGTFPFVWTDTNANQYPKRFYQVRLGP